MTLKELCDYWRGELMGTEVSGTVSDPESGEEAGYHLRCTAVSWSGLDDRIAITWDDQLSGGYRRWELTEAQLVSETAGTLADALRRQVEAVLADELEAQRYDGIVGEEL